MRRVNAVDIATGRRIPLNQPTLESWRNRICSLDLAALAETSAVLRRAIDDRVDLIVVEKFGDAERNGLDGIAAGIPLLVAVPETNFEAWRERTGGMGARLSRDETALHKWWEWVQGKDVTSSVALS